MKNIAIIVSTASAVVLTSALSALAGSSVTNEFGWTNRVTKGSTIVKVLDKVKGTSDSYNFANKREKFKIEDGKGGKYRGNITTGAREGKWTSFSTETEVLDRSTYKETSGSDYHTVSGSN